MTTVPIGPEVTFGTNSINVSPGPSLMASGGGCDASAVSGSPTDWYMHTQGYNGFYERREQFRDCNISKLNGPTAPSVEYNYIDARTTVWTNDQIMYNTTFSACAQVLQKINIQPSGACSAIVSGDAGWGSNGMYQTSGIGLLLRPARKDAGGNILDPTGVCQESFNFELGVAPGVYSCSSGWDTLSNARTDLARLGNELNNYCPTFNTNLVDI